MAARHVFMVPGFLGFVDLGRFPYFRGAAESLRAGWFNGEAPRVVRVETLPTSSLRERAARLAEVVREHASDDDGPIHIVAHSTGGLDARLLLTPGAELPVDFDLAPLLDRVASLVTIATPHRGTPLASFFDGVFGQRVLWLGSLCAAYAVRLGRVPVGAMARLARILKRPNNAAAVETAIADVEHELLDALPDDERGPWRRLLEGMTEDQALIPQLAPEGLELFNSATNDRPGVAYGCVVARARPPKFSTAFRAGLRPHAQASFAVYTAMHRIVAGMPDRRLRGLSELGPTLSRLFGDDVDWSDSDGVVPTLSQLWGEPIHAVQADHLDVVGHFSEHDILVSGSGFERAHFDAAWHDVARFMREAEQRSLVGRLPAPQWSRTSMPVLAEPRNVAPVVVPTTTPHLMRRWSLRLGAVTVAFVAYEGWRATVGDIAFALWPVFALCTLAVAWMTARKRPSPDRP